MYSRGHRRRWSSEKVRTMMTIDHAIRTEGIADDDSRSSDATASERASDPLLSVRDLEKTYGTGDDAVRAVDGVSFAIDEGEVVGLLGPNGAGKTTIIKSVLGLVEPDSGEVRIDDIPLGERRSERYRLVGAMLEGARNVYWRLSVRENMAFFASLQGYHPKDVRDRHDEYLEMLGLADRADTPVNELSRGMKQKASIACVLAREPSILFLDEPTLGLDVRAATDLRQELTRLSSEEGKTIVVCSHDMDVIGAVCDRVVILHEGRVVADETVDDLVDLFHAQAYRVSVETDGHAALRSRLESRFEIEEWSDTERGAAFEITLSSGERFFDLMAQLQAEGAIPITVDNVNPNMRDAYLHFTEGN